jgi:5-methyltetrahydropteroyltriglutamate--homocysteine methyltransferase
MSASVPILRREIELLREAAADTVQLDEPWLCTLVDPEFRRKEGVTDVQYEMNLCVDLINQTLDGIEGIDTVMHLCHAHFDRQHGSQGPYDLIMPALGKIRVGTISLEFATPVAGGVESLAQFPEHVRLGLGCIDHCDRKVETAEEVASRVRAAMRFVETERITLHPDCGFSPSVQNPMELDEAYLKLQSLCRGAEMLRSACDEGR